ncbi:MAG: septal ring lytic transglycosylase RlpA family protein [FCB group bacterium]|jgi:rare lipoprotein A|nr:septal ring lytic transglycosylase RlpA family protein [FCB group bacterium]
MFELVVLALISQQPLLPTVEGVASYYTVAETSTITASGEQFRNEAYTCAMNQGEFGKYYIVVAENGKSVVCRLNDRGPFVKGRVIDLSRAAMRKLHPTAGTIRVKVYPLGDNVPRHLAIFN